MSAIASSVEALASHLFYDAQNLHRRTLAEKDVRGDIDSFEGESREAAIAFLEKSLLEGEWTLKGLGLQTIAEAVEFCIRNKLHVIALQCYGDQVDNSTIDQLIKAKLNIKAIFINSSKISDEALLAIAENLTELRELDLSGCNEITDAGVLAIAENLTGLRKLDLRGCYKITDDVVSQLRQTLLQLKAWR